MNINIYIHNSFLLLMLYKYVFCLFFVSKIIKCFGNFNLIISNIEKIT